MAHLIAWDDSTPERNIRPAPRSACRIAFGREVRYGGRRRDRVERHVHDGGDAPGRRCARARPEALPVRSPGLVQMHMRAADGERAREAGV